MKKFRYYAAAGFLAIAMANLTGCAAQASYFRLEPSLTRDMASFGGVEYVPLARLCDAYGFECKWDSFIKTATIQKASGRIVLRAGSDSILVNGEEKRLEKPVVFNAGAVFVPVSFAKNNLAPLIGVAPAERPAEAVAPKLYTIRTVVIDAGHGGKDVGATGKKYRLREKDMALELARKLRALLEKAGIRVIMTRERDNFVPLPGRTEIANKAGADLFVSVHINASRTRSLRGFECYYLSNATDDSARALEALENASLKTGEGAAIEHSARLDKTLWDMALTEGRLESGELASYICDSVENSLAIGNRGTKSARFYVLKYARMPSVLVEAGYLSNRYEEKMLKEPQFLDRMAEAIAKGMLRYREEYERTEGFTKNASR